ncbi:MAG: GNAT family N-acetyltransferase [Caldilineaceae bacterium]
MTSSSEPTDDQLLDNPMWYSLVSHHTALAIGGATAKRYPPDVAIFAGCPDPAAPDWEALAALMAVDEVLVVPPVPLPANKGLIVEFFGKDMGRQYVYWASTGGTVSDPDIRVLGEDDVPEMLHLVELTHPGPFLPRTIRMGHYYGIWDGPKLIAMGGERMHPGRFCEISAVCTDPDYRQRGYARRLVLHLMGTILARGEVPMLHCSADNAPAIQLYEQLGFTLRGLNSFQVVRYVGVDGAGAAEG